MGWLWARAKFVIDDSEEGTAANEKLIDLRFFIQIDGKGAEATRGNSCVT